MTSASSLIDGVGGQSYLAKESHCASVYSTKPTPTSLDHLIQLSRSTRSTADGSRFFTLSSHTYVF